MSNRLESITNYVINLHKIPELGFLEFKTSSYIQQELNKLGLVSEVVLKTGVISFIDNNAKKTIAFRADMDALPINEETNLKFKSKHPNVMHACGHDAHMAMLLQFAQEIKTQICNVNILLVFQPSEETKGGGAKKLIDLGIFKRYNISEIYALHVNPEVNSGLIALRSGALMARSCEWKFKIITKGTHGAQPHNGVDATLAAANFVNQVHTIIARNLDPIKTGVVTIGTLNSGTTNNIVSAKALGSGIIRTFSNQDMLIIQKRILSIAKGLQIGFECDIKIEFIPSYPEVINDNDLFEQNKVFPNVINIEKQLICEDFAYYSQHMKGCFAFIGCKNETITNYSLHNAKFNFVISDLLTGVDWFKNICFNQKKA